MTDSTPEQIRISQLETQLSQANVQAEDQQKLRMIEHAARTVAEGKLAQIEQLLNQLLIEVEKLKASNS